MHTFLRNFSTAFSIYGWTLSLTHLTLFPTRWTLSRTHLCLFVRHSYEHILEEFHDCIFHIWLDSLTNTSDSLPNTLDSLMHTFDSLTNTFVPVRGTLSRTHLTLLQTHLTLSRTHFLACSWDPLTDTFLRNFSTELSVYGKTLSPTHLSLSRTHL